MPDLRGFLLRVVLWLPLAFAAWYYLSILHVAPIAWLSDLVLGGLFPDAITGVTQLGNRIEIATGFSAGMLQPGMSGGGGTIAFDINPLIYGYGLPLLTGLILASPGELEAKIFRILAGGVILLPLQAWGVSFDALKTLYFGLGPDVAGAVFDAAGIPPDAVAIGYQLGFLILPSVAPVLIWVGMHARYLQALAPGLGRLRDSSRTGA